jgi:hypothetical protein
MAKRPGWKSLPVVIPEFAHDQFEKLRENYGDAHGVSPSQPLMVAALSHAATVRSLEAALKAYRAECKKRGVRHGF